MPMKFANNASSTLAAGITNTDTTLTLSSGGGLFPTLTGTGTDYFWCTIANSSGAVEIIKVIGHAASSLSFTGITRAQDGTSASSWNSGDTVELRIVSAVLNDIPKLDEVNSYSNANYFARGSSIAAATTTDLSLATGNEVHITGSTTITSFGTVQAGATFVLIFDSTPIITHNGTSLILPSGSSITAVAGDSCTVVSEGSGNWKCTQYQRASGQSLVSGATLPIPVIMMTTNFGGL